MGITNGITIGGQAGIVAVSTVLPPDPEPTFGPTFWATLGLIVTTFITSAMGLWFQAYKEARDRRWRMEDAEAKARIARLAVETKDTLVDKLDENTALTRATLEAAGQKVDKPPGPWMQL